MTSPLKVLYFAKADERMYGVMRGCVPPGIELITLDEGTDAERLDKIRDVDVLLLAGRRLDSVFVDAARRLKLVLFLGVGYHDFVEEQSLAARGIRLAIAPAGTGSGVSEHAIMLMIAVCRRLSFMDAEMRRGIWHAHDMRPECRQLFGMTIGIVGLGRIGVEVARRLGAFGVTLLYHDIADKPAQLEQALNVRRVPFDDLLARSDLVTLHVPLTAATHGMIDRRALALMKPGSILVNCARGPVVDEAALIEALESGHLGGAGLDVFTVEPPTEVPLGRFRNVVLTPHIGSGTREVLFMKLEESFANVARWERGEALENEIALV